MTEHQKADWTESGGHPSEGDLLFYVDGELDAQAGTRVKAHLEACWSCRVNLEEVQGTIGDFIGYRNQALRRLAPPPPGGWRGFDARLKRLSESAVDRPWRLRILSLLTRPFTNLRGPFTNLRGAFNSPLTTRFTVASLILLAAAAAWVVFNRAPVVSATELLERATEAQTQKILSTSQPVIHQLIQIKRKPRPLSSAGAPSNENSRPEVAKVETWNDLNNARFKQVGGEDRPTGAGERNNAVAGARDRQGLLGGLEEIFRTNRLDWRRPLSAVSFAEWRKSLRGKTEEVRRERLADGVEALSLRTISTDAPRIGAVVEATLTVRARDWSPLRQSLRVRQEGGEVEYELLETGFEVVSLAVVHPSIFADSAPASLHTPAPVAAAARPAAETDTPPAALVSGRANHTPADAGLEIETLALLSKAGADLGEQVNVEHGPEGLLRIEGIVDSEARKQELRRALNPVLASASVRFEVETVEEALRRAKPDSGVPPVPQLLEQRATRANALPVEEELRGYLIAQGRFANERLDGEIQRLARGLANSSFNLRQRAQAMKRLSERFNAEQWQSFDIASRARLLSLLESQASALREQGHALSRSLQPIFKRNEPPSAGVGAGGIGDVTELKQAINQLVELAAASDRAIQAAFTLSTDAAPTQAIKTAAFWDALAGLERVAGQIQSGVVKLRTTPPVTKQ
jgi:hypothetical protein